MNPSTDHVNPEKGPDTRVALSSSTANVSPIGLAMGWAAITGIGSLVLAIILLVWRSSLDGSFLFDDYGNIFNRQETNRLWPVSDFLSNNRPVGLYSLAISKHFSGESAYGYHLFNLAVHAINAMLLYAGVLMSRHVWQRYRGDRTGLSAFWLAIAALIALFWAIHPLTTQAVTYIVQRYESIAAMGYLGAWVGLLVVLVSEHRRRRLLGYAMIAAFAWVGLMSKEVFATAPLSILLFDRQISRQTFRELLRRRWPVYALMLSPFSWFVLSVSRWFDTSRQTSMGLGMKEVNSWEYLRTQPEVILHYLKLSVWPDPQCIDYMWRIQQQPVVYLGLGAIILGLLMVGAWMYLAGIVGSKHEPNAPLASGAAITSTSPKEPAASAVGSVFDRGLIGWGILTFFFILAPTSSFMPIADLAVEHRMYLPLTIVVAAIVVATALAARRLWLSSENRPVFASGIGLVVLAIGTATAWKTHARNLEYQDDLAIWMGVTEVAPENPRGWYHAGSLIFQRGHHAKALPYMTSAVGFGGTSSPLYDIGLGDCLREAGQVDKALFYYHRAVENQPDLAQGHNNLGVVYLKRNQDEMAFRHFTIASELGRPESMHNLAMIHERRGDHREAIVWLKRAKEISTTKHEAQLGEAIQRRLRSNQEALFKKSEAEANP